jgi:CRP-like cAMP-binding protein
VAPGTLIMKDGDPGEFFCFLAEGELAVSKRGRRLHLLSTGECFGEMAVIGGNTRMRGADVTAQTRARVISIRADALRNASDACRMHFYQAFLEVLSSRLTAANARLASI